ncbi:hypothetical protein [Peribacillus simplex]|uniref:hypothetical protein n=1 Tax=Peribacillus simplex TaxID=1478 RepID=UPI003D268C78
MGNTHLLGTLINKKQFAEVLPVDASKKGGAWQTELRKAESYGRFEITGKGPGTRYNVLEVFDVPQERVHGNTGSIPHNFGVFDKTSLKYKMAKAMILLCAESDLVTVEYSPKRTFYEALDCNFENPKHIEELFSKRKMDSLSPIERFVHKLTSNNGKALNGIINGAFDLIRKGAFDGITLDEQFHIANFDHEHYEADELNNFEDIHALYKEARSEAQANVESTHGNFLFFSVKRHLINNEYHELIETDEKYKLLLDEKIDYIYSKYAIIKSAKTQMYDYESFDYDGTDMEYQNNGGHEAAETFKFDFQEHREDLAVKSADKFLNSGTIGIIDKNSVEPFAIDFTALLLNSDDYVTFVMKYRGLMMDVTTIKPTGFGIAV